MEGFSSQLLISETLIPDIFFVRYMPLLGKDSICLYLWSQMSFRGGSFSPEEASSYGALSSEDLNTALAELVTNGLLIRGSEGRFLPVDIRKVEVDSYLESMTGSDGTPVLKSDEKKRNVLASSIQKTFYLGNMQFQFYRLIDKCLYEYHFEDSVVYSLFSEGRDLKIHYNAAKMFDFAKSWYDRGYTTKEALSPYYDIKKRRTGMISLMGRLMRRRLNEMDLERINRWVQEYGADEELTEFAFRSNEWRGNVTSKHVEDKLKEWYAAGITTIDKASVYEAERHKENKAKSIRGRGRTNVRKTGIEAGITAAPEAAEEKKEELPIEVGDSILDMFSGDDDEDDS